MVLPRLEITHTAAKTNPKGAGQTPESLKLLELAVLDELKKAVLWSAQKKAAFDAR